jgi:transposase InsO family protein
MVASQYIEQGHETQCVLKVLKIALSTWYYQSKGTKQGARPSTHTRTTDGQSIPNEEVVTRIEHKLQQDFVDYGYIKVTHWLRQSFLMIINFKKVYRLMKENKLLYHQHSRDKKGKTFIQYRVPAPDMPFEHMEMDIKFIWVHGSRRMAYLLSVIDIKTRAILAWTLQYSIKKEDVINLMKAIQTHFCLPRRVTLRSDNGSQFEAKTVRDSLSEMNIQQEFSHVATPEDNGHIESYHAIVKKAVCNAFEFNVLQNAIDILDRFVRFYNTDRLHSGLGYQSPNKYYFSLGLHQEPHKDQNQILNLENGKKIFLHQFVESASN